MGCPERIREVLQAAGQSEPWGAAGDGWLERAGPAGPESCAPGSCAWSLHSYLFCWAQGWIQLLFGCCTLGTCSHHVQRGVPAAQNISWLCFIQVLLMLLRVSLQAGCRGACSWSDGAAAAACTNGVLSVLLTLPSSCISRRLHLRVSTQACVLFAWSCIFSRWC